jgi:type I restriction enzyme S subunit
MDSVAHLDSWQETTLGDIVEFKNGINFTKAQKGENGTPTVDVKNMYGPGVTVDLRNLYRVSKQIGADHLLEPYDLLFVRSSLKLEGVGWTSIFAGSSEPVSFCGFIIRARLKNGLPIDPLFLAYFCRSDAARQQLIAGSGKVAITNISQDVLARLQIPLPPLPEQRKIAAVLNLVQRAIEQQERLIALTTELKKALLHKLFTEGLRGEPQKQTEIGPVPESWEVLPLGEFLTEAQYGLSTKGTDSGTYPLLRMTNQQEGRISSDYLQYVELTEDQFRKFRMERRDILFNRTNSLDLVGRTAIFDIEGDFVFASYLIRLRTESGRLRPFFLNHYFNWDETQGRLKSIATRAVSQSNISATRLRGFHVPVPDPKEQDEIVENLDCFDRKLAVHSRKKQCLTDLFCTLLHQLMTAQIRVHDLDLDEILLEPVRQGENELSPSSTHAVQRAASSSQLVSDR